MPKYFQLVFFLFLISSSLSFSQSLDNVFIVTENPPNDAQLQVYFDAIIANLEDLVSNHPNAIYLDRKNLGDIFQLSKNEDFIQEVKSEIEKAPDNSEIKRARNIIKVEIQFTIPRLQLKLSLIDLTTSQSKILNTYLKSKILSPSNPQRLRGKLKPLVDKFAGIDKKNTFQKYPKTWTTGIASVGLITWGGIEFSDAKSIHNQYEKYPKESEFTENVPGYLTREDAYNDAERRRKASAWKLGAGGLLAVAGVLFYMKEHRKVKRGEEDQSSGSSSRFRFEIDNAVLGSTGLKLIYTF